MIDTFEFWKQHPCKENPFFCRSYVRWRRASHLYKYILCLL